LFRREPYGDARTTSRSSDDSDHQAQRRRERAAAQQAAALARQHRRRLLITGGVALAVLALAALVIVIAAQSGGTARTGARATTATSPAAVAPSWPAPAPDQVPAAVRAAGLPLLSMEATDVHFHAHLDIIINGQPVTVPANIGIAGTTGISSLHTHDPTGIIHIESPTQATFTLGQFFTEWKIRLSGTCLNDVCATSANTWRFYVNGQPYTGDPTALPLAAHQEIAAVYGAPPNGTAPPDHYDFPAGL
jgi:hypothetical protein